MSRITTLAGVLALQLSAAHAASIDTLASERTLQPPLAASAAAPGASVAANVVGTTAQTLSADGAIAIPVPPALWMFGAAIAVFAGVATRQSR